MEPYSIFAIMLQKRNTIISSILLVLYCFLMLPVQIWHTHANHTHCSKEGNNEWMLTAGDVSGDSDTCQICDHKYADFTDENSFLRQLNKIAWKQSASSLFYHTIKAVEATRLYRGPPAFS